MHRCDYCESSFNVGKFKYFGRTRDGKRKQKTLRFCLDCQCQGVASSQDKISKIFDSVEDRTIRCANGMQMYAY